MPMRIPDRLSEDMRASVVQPGGMGAVRRTSLPMGLNREVPSTGLCRLIEGGGEAVLAAVCARPRAQRRS